MNHFHYGYGMAGYGLNDSAGIATTLDDLRECVHAGLDDVIDSLINSAFSEREEFTRMYANGPTQGDYRGSHEHMTDCASRAFEFQGMANDADTLRINLRAERRTAPLYRDDAKAWADMLRTTMGVNAFTNVLVYLDLAQQHGYGVRECDRWECLISEHDDPAGTHTDGYTPCVCRDCPEIVIFTSDELPYCDACTGAECATRSYPGCERERDDDE